MNLDDRKAIDFYSLHAMLTYEIAANFLLIGYICPEFIQYFLSVFYAFKLKTTTTLFAQAKKNVATIAIGKGAISFPSIFRKLALPIAPLG